MPGCLLIVDPQYDFIAGALPVPGARAAMQALAAHIRKNRDSYAVAAITCDFHPLKHCSFQDNGGQWPVHCVAHSRGASIWPDVLSAAQEIPGPLEIFHKGTDAACEEYSIFQNPASSARLLATLKANKIDSLDICGIAGDICVLNTLKDCGRLLKDMRIGVLADFSPSLDGGRQLSDYCARESICIR